MMPSITSKRFFLTRVRGDIVAVRQGKFNLLRLAVYRTTRRPLIAKPAIPFDPPYSVRKKRNNKGDFVLSKAEFLERVLLL